MLWLAWTNLGRRPLRTALTLLGLVVSIGAMACLLSLGEGYQKSLSRELDGMGMQMMLVPLGCPYDAAARVLKGRALDVTLPQNALEIARADPAVAVAAPLYTAALPRPSENRTDLWVGIDDATRALKPWWRLTPGSHWFDGPNCVILGADAAQAELRAPGDKFYSPESGRVLTVSGVLEHSGTSDDSQFFVPLATAQAMFHQPKRLTAVAIRLKDPAQLLDASERLQAVPGAQVVTLTEMMGTFLNLMGAARSLTLAVALVALAVSALGVFNTMMAATLERTREIGVLRAVGLSRPAAFGLMALESLMLTLGGGLLGLALAGVGGSLMQTLARPFLPLAPTAALPPLTLSAAASCLLVVIFVGGLAGFYPAWTASRLRPADALRIE